MFCFAGCKKEKERCMALYEEKIMFLRAEIERSQCSNRSLLLENKRKEDLIKDLTKKKEQKKKDSAGTSNGTRVVVIDEAK